MASSVSHNALIQEGLASLHAPVEDSALPTGLFLQTAAWKGSLAAAEDRWESSAWRVGCQSCRWAFQGGAAHGHCGGKDGRGLRNTGRSCELPWGKTPALRRCLTEGGSSETGDSLPPAITYTNIDG